MEPDQQESEPTAEPDAAAEAPPPAGPRPRFMPPPPEVAGSAFGPPPVQQRSFGWEQALASPAPLPPPRMAVGVFGLCLVGLGMILILIGLTGLDWLTSSLPFGGATFSDIHKLTDLAPSGEAGLAVVYYGWLAWVLFALGLVLGIAANLPISANGAMRVSGVVVGVAAAAITFFAIKLGSQGAGIGSYLSHSGPGYWLTIVGFLSIAIGAAIRPAVL